ncbi:hypothetical protein [Maribacter halichondriae]|uniref:hypothetical protein n=1 Tax=Maribacter halichondriae TaxID=2980554 RepID=UPI0023598D7C|nr:hypothetical protein [Maribacter sp. Hal144]
MGNIKYILVVALVLISCKRSDSHSQVKGYYYESNALLGSWDIKEVHWISKDTTLVIKKAQPGIFMVTPERYSIIWTPTKHPRQKFNVLSKPTDNEIKSGFNSIVFNSGTYTSTSSKMVTKALIAKVPGFEGGRQYYDYRIEEGTLFLTMYDETYPDGTKPDWAGKWKTHFILKKLIRIPRLKNRFNLSYTINQWCKELSSLWF